MKRFFLLAFWVTAVGFAQKPIFTTAKIKAATVYFNAADYPKPLQSICLPERVKSLLKMWPIT
jgi:hypothetical protein